MTLNNPSNNGVTLKSGLGPLSLKGPKLDFRVTPLFDAEYLIDGTRYKNSYNGIRKY